MALIVAGLAVIAVVTVTVTVAMTTRGALERAMLEQRDAEVKIVNGLTKMVTGGLMTEDEAVRQLSGEFQARIVLTDEYQNVLADSGSGDLPPEAGSIAKLEYGADKSIIGKMPPLRVFVGFAVPPQIPWGLLGGIAAGIIAVAALVAIPLGRVVSRPLGSLACAARSIRDGNLDVRVDTATPSEVADLAGSFNDMAAELARADSQRKQLTADIAHELRSPLTNILGHLDAIEDQVIEPTPDQIGIITSEAVRLARLVDDLQTLAALDERTLRLKVAPVDICKAIDVAIEARRGRAAEKKLTLEREGVCEGEIALDRTRFEQIVGNLLDNALEHTPEGGRVSVCVSDGTGKVEVTVSDTGPGIHPEFLPHLFDRLARADPSRTPGSGGRGLGLTIARGLARAHGGDITASNRPEGGASFVVTLAARGDG